MAPTLPEAQTLGAGVDDLPGDGDGPRGVRGVAGGRARRLGAGGGHRRLAGRALPAVRRRGRADRPRPLPGVAPGALIPGNVTWRGRPGYPTCGGKGLAV